MLIKFGNNTILLNGFGVIMTIKFVMSSMSALSQYVDYQ